MCCFPTWGGGVCLEAILLTVKKYALIAKCLSGQTIKSYEIQVGRLQEHIRLPSALRHNNRTQLETCNNTTASKCHPFTCFHRMRVSLGFFFFLWLYDFKRRQSWKTCFPDACPWKYCLLLCKLWSRRPLHPFCCLASTDVSNIVWPACSLMESNDLRPNKRAVCVRQKVATMLNINLLCCERESHIVKWTTVFCVCDLLLKCRSMVT